MLSYVCTTVTWDTEEGSFLSHTQTHAHKVFNVQSSAKNVTALIQDDLDNHSHKQSESLRCSGHASGRKYHLNRSLQVSTVNKLFFCTIIL